MDQTSLLYWFPILEKNKEKLNLPQTFIVPLTKFKDIDIYKLLDYDRETIEKLKTTYIPQLQSIFDQLGFPLFLKTDYYSGKHSWNMTCFVPTKEILISNLCHLVEDSFCASLRGLPMNALVFRKYIPLTSSFTFFNGKLPIAKERRYFIRDHQVICHHPYWDKAVFKSEFNEFQRFNIKFDDSTRKDVLEKVDQLNKESQEEIKILTEQCNSICPFFDGFWSVDFAEGQDKKWYLIDMALGDQSWHPDCPNNPETDNKD